MRLLIVVLSALTFFVSAAAAQTRTFPIMDNEGFGRAMPAYTLELPANWHAEGKIAWQKPCSGNDHFEMILMIQSPDGRSGFRVQPGHQILWTEGYFSGLDPQLAQMMTAQMEAERNQLRTQFRNSNCHVAKVNGTEQLLRGLVLNQRPQGTRVVKVAPNPGARQALEQMLVGSTGNMRVSFDAVEVEMEYVRNGQPTVERLWFSWFQTEFLPQGTGADTYQQHTVTENLRMIWVDPANRQQQEQELEQILATLKVDATWQNEIDEFYRKLRKQGEQDAAAREAARARREAESDRRHKEFLDMIAQ